MASNKIDLKHRPAQASQNEGLWVHMGFSKVTNTAWAPAPQWSLYVQNSRSVVELLEADISREKCSYNWFVLQLGISVVIDMFDIAKRYKAPKRCHETREV